MEYKSYIVTNIYICSFMHVCLDSEVENLRKVSSCRTISKWLSFDCS